MSILPDCWSIDSSSLLVSLIFVAPFLGSFAYNTASAIGTLLVDLWFFIFLCYDFFNVYFLRRQVEENEEIADEMQEKIKKFQERLNKLPASVKAKADKKSFNQQEYIIDVGPNKDEDSDDDDEPAAKKPKSKKMSRMLDFLSVKKSNSKKD